MESKSEEIRGYKRCPTWLREAYLRGANYTCQTCHKHQDKVGTLEIHRHKRGNKGGLYTVYPFTHKLNNVKVVCNGCHKIHHSNEFSHVSHSY